MMTADRHGSRTPSEKVKFTPVKLTPARGTGAPLAFLSSMYSIALPSTGLYINSVICRAAVSEMVTEANAGALHLVPLFARTVTMDDFSIGIGMPAASISIASRLKLKSLSDREPRCTSTASTFLPVRNSGWSTK